MVVTSITICAEGFYCLAFRSNLHFSENWGSSSSQLLSLVIRPRVELWLNLSRSSVAAHRLKRPELHQNRSRKDHDSSVDFLTGHNYELNLIVPKLRQNNSKIGNSPHRSLIIAKRWILTILREGSHNDLTYEQISLRLKQVFRELTDNKKSSYDVGFEFHLPTSWA